jgi:hypothetical protein
LPGKSVDLTVTVDGAHDTSVTVTVPPGAGTVRPKPASPGVWIYTAPGDKADPRDPNERTANRTVLVTVRSKVDPTKSDTATITLAPGPTLP